MKTEFAVNGIAHEIVADERTTLLDALRVQRRRSD
jgi:aerobic-type carbon monoxide dehydrogenase small subunit (CoxS/CutS family)